jgi:5'-nucleotidase
VDCGIAVDELMVLGGLDKGEFLKAFEPDFYFDDQPGHIDSARAHVAAGHVPFGVANLSRGKAP